MKAICVVDVQNDFMNADGALPVPGTDKIRGKLAQIAKFARDNRFLIFFTQDEHDGTEPEMQANGGPFPLHCMKGTIGQQNIPEMSPLGYTLFTKKCYDVFDPTLGNNYIEQYLKDAPIDQVFICGVVGNICVEAASLGMAKRGIDVTIWDDAVVFMDLGPDNNIGTSWKKMAAAGVGFGLFDSMKGMLL